MRVADTGVGDVVEMLNEMPIVGLVPSTVLFTVIRREKEKIFALRKGADIEEELPGDAHCLVRRAGNGRVW